MRAFEVGEPFGLDSLRLVDRPDPVPSPSQVVLELHAFSLNYRDLLVVNGTDRWRPAGRRVPVSDAVGVVVQAGPGVTRVRVGDRVCPIFYPRWADGAPTPARLESPLGGAAADGMLAEYAAVEEASVVTVPDHLSDEEAATLPCAGVTAWNAVAEALAVTPGETLVTLGTGGVSLFALQFARLRGARVVITSSSDAKLARAAGLGAAAGVNYRAHPDWPQAVKELTDGEGADHVVDTAGDLKQAIAAVRMGGSVAFVGLLVGLTTEIDLVALMGRSARIQAVDVGSRATFEAMNHAIAAHGLRPVVDRVFGFAEAPEALRYISEGSHFGKVCLRR
jgi:NADPH:quinone reductase-like Zn-dependent oxidoreductase